MIKGKFLILCFFNLALNSLAIAADAGKAGEIDQSKINEMPYIDLQSIGGVTSPSAPVANPNAQPKQTNSPQTVQNYLGMAEKKAPKIIKPVVWIDMYDNATISTPRIKVRDIALITNNNEIITNEINNYDIGLAPDLGKEIKINPNELKGKLLLKFPLYDFKFNNLQEIIVDRSHEVFDAKAIKELISNYEKNKADNPEKFTIDFFGDINSENLSGEGWQVSVSRDAVANNEFRNWKLLFHNDNQEQRSLLIRGKIVSDLQGVQNKTEIVTKKIDSKKEPALAKEANTEKQDVIKKGSKITLSYNNSALSISTAATALDNGAIGDFIRVKNNNNQIISAKVLDANQVSVTN